jgi:putative oxidoreductase
MSPEALFKTHTGSDSISIGLLVLRLVALSLFLKHGLEKLTGYPKMVQHFPNLLHIGAHAGLAFALLSDGICSVLVFIGLATRPAAAVILFNLLTAFFLVHHAEYFTNGHVELVMVYIIVFTACYSRAPGDSASTGTCNHLPEIIWAWG